MEGGTGQLVDRPSCPHHHVSNSSIHGRVKRVRSLKPVSSRIRLKALFVNFDCRESSGATWSRQILESVATASFDEQRP